MSTQIGIHRLAITVAASAAFVAAWSSGFVIAAVATVDVSPLTLLVWRFVPLAVLLLVASAATGAFRSVTAVGVRRQAAVGLFAQFGYCAAVYAAIAAGIATGTTALIDAIQPLVVAMLVGPLLGLKVRGAQWAGLAVGALGALLVIQSQFGASGAPAIAYVLPALAMASLIVGTFLQRRTTSHMGVLATLTIHVTVTALALVAAAAARGVLAPPTTTAFWLSATAAAVFPTLVAYGLYWWLLRRIGITALNALLFLVAPATAVAGAVLLAEPLTAVTIAGFLLCGAGVAAVLASDHQYTDATPRRVANRRQPAGITSTQGEPPSTGVPGSAPWVHHLAS